VIIRHPTAKTTSRNKHRMNEEGRRKKAKQKEAPIRRITQTKPIHPYQPWPSCGEHELIN